MRRILVTWHRWFGLLAALWLLLLAVTGSVLVFRGELDRVLNPDLLAPAPAASSQPLEEIRRIVETRYPGTYAAYLVPTASGSGVLDVSIAPRVGSDAVSRSVFVEMATGRIRGDRGEAEMSLDRRQLMPFIYSLHDSLHLGEWGIWFLGLVAFLWTADHIVGAYLAVTATRSWRDALKVRWSSGSYKRTFDLHRSVGVWVLPITFVLAFTGIHFNWNAPFNTALTTVAPLQPRVVEGLAPLRAPAYDPPIDFDEARSIAERASGRRLDSLLFVPSTGHYRARMIDTRDIYDTATHEVFIRSSDGHVIEQLHIRDGGTGDAILAWMYPLHSGKAFGWPGRLAVFAAGVLVVMFVVTGLLIWNKKRKARTGKAAAARNAQRPRKSLPA